MKNWKTTLSGVAAILLTGLSIYSKKSVSPEDVATLTAGVGLVLANDAGVTGTAK